MNGTVGAWEPPKALGERHAATLDAALAGLEGEGVSECAAARLREVMNAAPDAQAEFFAERDSRQLACWLRVLTLAEMTVPGCERGAKSPVVALARTLRERGAYPSELTDWIRSVSTNRFLPYGSLEDRLAASKPTVRTVRTDRE